jgi:hypothetical protein
MTQKDIYEMESLPYVTLREHLESMIKMNNDHLLEIIKQDKQYVKEAFDLYEKNVDIHLDRLNHSHENIKDIALKNISQDKFDSLHKELTMKVDAGLQNLSDRIDTIEKNEKAKGVESKSTIAVIVVLGSTIASALALFINHFIK